MTRTGSPRLVDRVGCFDVLANRVNGDEEEDEVRLRKERDEWLM